MRLYERRTIGPIPVAIGAIAIAIVAGLITNAIVTGSSSTHIFASILGPFIAAIAAGLASVLIVSLDENELVVSFAFGLFTTRVRKDAILVARPIPRPFSLGYRLGPGSRAYLIGSGTPLELRLTNGDRLIIDIDDTKSFVDALGL